MFVYIKNEGANLGTMVATVNVIVSCENLGLEEPFQSTCFGHAMLKACQYDITNNKVSMGFPWHLYLNCLHKLLEVYKMAWKIRERLVGMDKVGIDVGMQPWKLSILMKTRWNSTKIVIELCSWLLYFLVFYELHLWFFFVLFIASSNVLFCVFVNE